VSDAHVSTRRHKTLTIVVSKRGRETPHFSGTESRIAKKPQKFASRFSALIAFVKRDPELGRVNTDRVKKIFGVPLEAHAVRNELNSLRFAFSFAPLRWRPVRLPHQIGVYPIYCGPGFAMVAATV
jgi:hypothetical protein